MNVLYLLQKRFLDALTGMVENPASYAGLIKPAQDPRYGDYQSNCAMPVAKVLNEKAPAVARGILERLKIDDVAEAPEVAGPGFINLRLRTEWVASQLGGLARDENLGAEPARQPRRLVIDFSSPNVAKPMHVGHLRSTIIGDALARLFRFLGHEVITDNHLGDWGTQFGMLLYGYKNHRDDAAFEEDPVRELNRLYVLVRSLTKGEVEEGEQATDVVAEAARQETVKLHAGDEENVRLWRMFMPCCRQEIDRVYERLDVRFDQTLGESFYNPMLPEVVRDLQAKGLAKTSEGAVGIFFGEEEPPALVRKKDGAFTYTTTDLATIRYRMETWDPTSILYVVDSRQALHFKNIFDAARRWGYTDVKLEHISFGSVLGPDRKPIKTRDGGAVELSDLLGEAVERALAVYEESRAARRERGEEVPELSLDERRRIAEVVGLGAVKYADLSQNRATDYLFSWEKMLAMEGNTATYMQYAYARVRNIFRKGNEEFEIFQTQPPPAYLEQPAERALALKLLQFPEILEAAAAEYKLNVITNYLWELAKAYSGFYQNCHVLNAESPMLRQSRLLLCYLTAQIIGKGLELLGIKTVERM